MASNTSSLSDPSAQLDYCIVLVTIGSQAEAIALGTLLVDQSLAACVNVVPIQSIYRWNGAVQQDSEWQLIIKTTTQRWQDLQHTVQMQHSYDLPELIAIPIVAGSEGYLSWLKTETAAS